MYSDLVKNKTFPSLDIPQTIVPTPLNEDYDSGAITRYFIQKANDPNGFVFEVDFNVFKNLQYNPYWITDDMLWRIKGPKEKTYNSIGELLDNGVIESNKSSIAITSFKIKNISLYLPNLLQFYK
jgi:hypothetical protein